VAEQPKGVSVGTGEGRSYWFLGTLVTIKIDGSQTGGRFSLSEVLFPKDAAPPVHSHPQDETFIIVDGSVTVWLDGEKHRCSAGSIVCAPGGVPHTFLVESETARVQTISTPAGIERFFTMLGEPTTEMRLPDDDVFPDKEAIDAAYAACDVRVLGPAPAPE
jgi:quercetin dioxygenase-like cupin family protein